MIKRILVVSLLTSLITTSQQSLAQDPLIVSTVQPMSGVTQEALFNRAYLWAADKDDSNFIKL